MRIAVPRESAPGERRVALVPESCKKLIQIGYDIAVESSAGAAAGFPDAAYVDAGAGVAGLQAIATARRLGANVVATDVRPEVKEQIESVGAKYVGVELAQDAAAGGGYAKELSEADRERQRELLAAECAKSDVVIT